MAEQVRSVIPAVHLGENHPSAKRSLTTGRAFPIGEPDRPARSAQTASERVLEQISIVRYLDVENSPRYQPSQGKTFCNVYACDYCYLNGVYLPRVWWTAAALADLSRGRLVPVTYGKTVAELNANALYDWLCCFGPSFGWRRVPSLDELQRAADEGGIGVICAQHADLNRSGHISLVVPQSAPPLTAQRAGSAILLPLQSQAGRKNFCFSCRAGPWWASPQFRAFGFWTHT